MDIEWNAPSYGLQCLYHFLWQKKISIIKTLWLYESLLLLLEGAELNSEIDGTSIVNFSLVKCRTK
jgi:hypothetical protein